MDTTTKNKQRNQRGKNALLRLKKKILAQDLNRKLGVQLIGEMKRSESSRGEREREVDENVR